MTEHNLDAHIPDPRSAIDMNKLLTPEEVCEWFAITKDLLYDLCQQKKIPYIRVGGRQLRFQQSELKDYLAERHKEATVE